MILAESQYYSLIFFFNFFIYAITTITFEIGLPNHLCTQPLQGTNCSVITATVQSLCNGSPPTPSHPLHACPQAAVTTFLHTTPLDLHGFASQGDAFFEEHKKPIVVLYICVCVCVYTDSGEPGGCLLPSSCKESLFYFSPST